MANTVSVNTGTVITTNVRGKLGINVNGGVDKDSNRPAGARPLREAIADVGAKVIRFPGGKKSLYYSWASAPYTDPKTNYWVPGWYANAALDTMNFDEFMTLCRETDAVPHINVAYNPGAGLGSELAAKWVKYANVTKGYNVKYWEIGNEMWQTDLGFTAETLAAVVIEYSNAMKAVDPNIKIGVSWKHSNYGVAQTFIDLCGNALDFFNISNYAWWGGSFEAYRTTPNQDLNMVLPGLSLKTIISEYNTNFWDGTPENDLNATAKGLIVFDMAGQFLKDPKCEYACFWNTRWYSMAGTTHDGFGNQNNLLPNTQPLTFYQKYLHDTMVGATSSTGDVVTYASYNSTTKGLTVYLINKQTASRTVSIDLTSGNDYSGTADMERYAGTGYFDVSPTIGPIASATVTNNTISNLVLPATSITAISLSAPGTTPEVSVNATDFIATEQGATTGEWTITRTGSTTAALTVPFTIKGIADVDNDYTASELASITIPIGQSTATVTLTAVDDTVANEGDETVALTITPNAAFSILDGADTITITDNDQRNLVDAATPNGSQPLSGAADWTLVFSDEFNAAQLDTTKWGIDVSSSSRASRATRGIDDWWWKAENVKMDGSNLVLDVTKFDSNTMHCGSVSSDGLYEPHYGYLEARIQIADSTKDTHTAFWLQGPNMQNSDPADGTAHDGAEVDIFESAWFGDYTKAVVHIDGYDADKASSTKQYSTPNLHTGYHTFGLEWTETSMKIYYDGVLKVTYTGIWVPMVPEWLWLSCGASFGDIGTFSSEPNGLLTSAKVDYVRVWQHVNKITVTETGGATGVAEGGASDSFTVVLDKAPVADVTVTLSTDSQVDASPTSLTFKTTNWNTPQAVTVSAVDDAVFEGAHTGTVSHAVTSTDPYFDGVNLADISASIVDNDTVPTYTLTYTAGTGGSVTGASPQTVNHGNDGTTVTAAPDTGYRFVDWSDGLTTASRTDTNVTADVTVTANFSPNTPPTVDAGPDQTASLMEGAAWSPSEIDTVAWYDADDASTITHTVGTVSQWADKSGLANHLTAVNDPKTGTRTMNNRNVIDFASDYFSMASAINMLGKSAFLAIEADSVSDNRIMIGNQTVNVQLRIEKTAAKLQYTAASLHYADPMSTGAVSATQPTVAGFLLNSTMQFSLNGTFEDSGVAGGSGSTTYNKIGSGDGTRKPFDGKIGEVIITSAIPDIVTRQKIEGYLAHKWGTVGSLPGGHPYRTVAPGMTAATVNLDGASVTDPDAGDTVTTVWSVTSTEPAGLEATVTFGNTSAIVTTATFTTEGIYTLRLTANDGTGPVSGECVITVGTPEIKISGNSAEIISGDYDPSPDDQTDFGDVAADTTKDVTFTIANTGNFANLNLDGNPIVSISGDPTFTLQTPPSGSVTPGTETTFVIRFAPTTSGVQTARISIDNDDPDENPYTFDVTGNGISGSSATVVASHIFYNNSSWDGDAGASVADDDAIATDKAPLLTTDLQASFSNYTSYLKGINGIMIDVENMTGTPGASDFTFKVGNTATPTATAPAPAISVRAGAGQGGSDRITLIWADGAITNTWLQVTVKAAGNIGLAADHVFYYGNAVAETGNNSSDTAVDVFDMLGARNNVTEADAAAIDDNCDFNRDKAVDVFDMLGARNNVTDSGSEVNLITPP